MDKMDYKKLKKELLSKVGASGIMPLISNIDSSSDDELIK